ncbi:glycyl-radical enzyme activating protein [Desulforegula conservatrix]|uniref:glycyl-radical enzyme activating protein n=1 Tax=Desulforegula conservatrix TaxID=153026 RepID=UPI00048A322A|nr:glycyl-radical enzyme activating protein [Desulforegula conservatrix]
MSENNDKLPLILDIKANSLDDGPGIRSVVFFKGCPLSCVWCHNPESRKASPEIAFDTEKCIDCGSCRDLCTEKALSQKNAFYVDRKACKLCFKCADSCPSAALEMVGKPMNIDEILAKILPDKPFFDVSSGGVTLSGGEATLHMEFLSELLKSLKKNGIHSLLETCGFFDHERFMELVYPYTDSIFFDVKIMDSMDHKKFCGLPNERILDNFRQIARTARLDGKAFLPRTPLVPDITDTEANIKAVAAFYNETGITEAALLSYNPLWHDKSRKMGAENPYVNNTAMTSFSDKTVMERCRRIFENKGIKVFE